MEATSDLAESSSAAPAPTLVLPNPWRTNNKKLDTFFIFIQMFIFKGPNRSGRITRAPAANISPMAKCLNIAYGLAGRKMLKTKLKLKSGDRSAPLTVVLFLEGSPLWRG